MEVNKIKLKSKPNVCGSISVMIENSNLLIEELKYYESLCYQQANELLVKINEIFKVKYEYGGCVFSQHTHNDNYEYNGYFLLCFNPLKPMKLSDKKVNNISKTLYENNIPEYNFYGGGVSHTGSLSIFYIS